jgi:2-keto-4-pentenoate hydratase/2-oxohepta-3-ene-1,7-dioic acid hydratase in catechol pathway
MKIATCSYRDRLRPCRIEEDHAVIPDSTSSVLDLLDGGAGALNVFRKAPGERIDLDSLTLVAPIPRPRKNIICLGWNYAEHVNETSATSGRDPKMPKDPIVFTKNVTSISGHGAPIPWNPSVSSELDWEVELGVIIGTGGRHIKREDALSHVLGYTIINDISARDLQFRHKQFFIGKSLDGACPMGPWIVTSDEIADPQNLHLECRVNGVIKQSSTTAQQIFDVATVIETLSRVMTLEPGDIIATGTPSGVGFARTPPEFLKPGDIVECEIEGIGILRNPVVAQSA